MSEKYKELLEQYDVKVLSTFRSRGTFQCETEQGLALLKEYHGSLQKLALEYEWKEKLANAGFLTTDRYFLTKEESLVTYDRYRTPFVLKHYFKGRECDCRNLSDVAASCRNLAFLHKVSSSIEEIPFENLKTETTSHLFERKNRELRSIRKFIGKVRGKNDFELLYMNCFDSFYKEASHALAHLLKAEADLADTDCGMCHGAYHYHNVLILPDYSVATVNFESLCYQPYLLDFYLFLRKTLEKIITTMPFLRQGFPVILFTDISQKRFSFLIFTFLYPEKFWKISNQYYNHRKSWISPRTLEKLQKFWHRMKNDILF